MGECLASFDVANCRFGNPISRTECALAFIGIDDADGIFIRQNGVWATFAVLIGLPPSGDFVSHIVERRPLIEMLWIDAKRHIAMVARAHSRLQWSAIRQFPCDSMGLLHRAIVPKLAVSFRGARARPQDAAIWPRLRVEGQFAGQRNLARRILMYTLRSSHDRLPTAIAVRVGASVSALLRPADCSTVPCA